MALWNRRLTNTAWMRTTNFSHRTPSSTVASTTCSTRDIRRPSGPYGGGSFGSTPESLEQLLAEEEPDPAMRLYDPIDKDEQQRSDEAERETEFPQRNEVGRARAGRLVAPDKGFGEDLEADLVADDVGIDGGVASAEEAAVHIIDDEE